MQHDADSVNRNAQELDQAYCILIICICPLEKIRRGYHQVLKGL